MPTSQPLPPAAGVRDSVYPQKEWVGRNLRNGPGEKMSSQLAPAGSEGTRTPTPGKLVGPSLGGECAVGVGPMLLEAFWLGGQRQPLLLFKNHSMLKCWVGAAGGFRDKIRDAQLNSISRKSNEFV